MSTTLTLGTVVLALPLRVERRYSIVTALGASCGEAWAPEVSRLFAAAPDLLVAAEALDALSNAPAVRRGKVREWNDAYRALRTAIARARGKEQG